MESRDDDARALRRPQLQEWMLAMPLAIRHLLLRLIHGFPHFPSLQSLLQILGGEMTSKVEANKCVENSLQGTRRLCLDGYVLQVFNVRELMKGYLAHENWSTTVLEHRQKSISIPFITFCPYNRISASKSHIILSISLTLTTSLV